MLLAVNVGISSGILFIPCHYLLHVKISLFWKISSRYISGIGRKARYIGKGEQSNQSIKKKKKWTKTFSRQGMGNAACFQLGQFPVLGNEFISAVWMTKRNCTNQRGFILPSGAGSFSLSGNGSCAVAFPVMETSPCSPDGRFTVTPWGEKAQILGLCLSNYYHRLYRFLIVLIANLPFKVV